VLATAGVLNTATGRLLYIEAASKHNLRIVNVSAVGGCEHDGEAQHGAVLELVLAQVVCELGILALHYRTNHSTAELTEEHRMTHIDGGITVVKQNEVDKLVYTTIDITLGLGLHLQIFAQHIK
jgi:hypothetical protein